jgi:UDP-N-acetylglucosamine--N-acetylmuramyl-(pentapeptide) pyrophosphoryl-undecaprenol N-acetylglucosamine transferase
VPRTIVLAGGGTGGHVYPALAIGDALKARGHEILYYGDPDRLEGKVVEKRGYAFRAVHAVGYPRSGWVGRFRFAFALLRETLRAATMLRKDRADMVFGVGGYVSAPTVLASWLLRVPRAVHEANVAPGLANRLCAHVANLVLLTYPQTARLLAHDAPHEIVGCPVNPKVLEGDRGLSRKRYGLRPDLPVLLVVGGSLGAARLNEVAVAAARSATRRYQILHVTGPKYHEEISGLLAPLDGDGSQRPPVIVRDYEHKMGDAYAAADLVLCRAGSSTLAELTALGKPSVLIPSPNVTDNHQEANARGLESVGAAMVFTETDLDMAHVLDILDRLLFDSAALRVMSEAASALGRPGTAEHVADLLLERLPVRGRPASASAEGHP